VRLEFKFLESAPPDRRESVVDEVAKLGATRVERVFPDEQDPELASLYKAEGVPDHRADAIVKQIGSHDVVEYAEPTPERKLIR
jgi:hypothetical protein